jgi:hypothetical protein
MQHIGKNSPSKLVEPHELVIRSRQWGIAAISRHIHFATAISSVDCPLSGGDLWAASDRFGPTADGRFNPVHPGNTSSLMALLTNNMLESVSWPARLVNRAGRRWEDLRRLAVNACKYCGVQSRATGDQSPDGGGQSFGASDQSRD